MKIKTTSQIVDEVIASSIQFKQAKDEEHNNKEIWTEAEEEMRKNPSEFYQPEVSINPPEQNELY